MYLSIIKRVIMNYSKYIIYLVFTTSFFQLVSAQDNSNSSSKGVKLSSEPKKKKSFLKPSNLSNPFLKKLKNKDVKDFFPDSDMNKNSSEDFIDNTKYYLTRLNAQANESKKNINKFKVDMFLGEISTDGDLINIVLRDHEYPDGDIIEVLVNDKIVLPAILLSETAVGFKLDLKTGFNVIDFVALNQGSSGPNTAEVRVYDDIGNLVGNNRWNLATGVKATYIVYKN
ncbi:uncharacterized protein METZ01_LOCUS56368 [marine metagenome]|uniref:Secreted protein n=1 Tax=marine metagenome TaxID=408172 RepID=A0A381SJ98_9ZZZZ